MRLFYLLFNIFLFISFICGIIGTYLFFYEYSFYDKFNKNIDYLNIYSQIVEVYPFSITFELLAIILLCFSIFAKSEYDKMTRNI